jgi:glutathione gamma-glutamylcysteinyltransferase
MSSFVCKLPENLVDYRSNESKLRLVRSLTNDTAVPFLSLSSCYNTQSQRSYCGLSTLAIILNAFRIDPSRLLETPQRWYTEDLLHSCRPLELVEKIGITMEVFQCLALRNGANCEITRPKDDNKDYVNFHKAICCSCTGNEDKENVYGAFVERENQHEVVAVAYDRYSLDMLGLAPGIGHYSPVGAYDKETDSVLVLDVARYKYPPHWVPIQLLFKAMLPVDQETGKSRGYFTLSKRKTNEIVCISQKCDCFYKQ